MNDCHDWLKIWMKNQLVSDINCNLKNYDARFLYKAWQIMLGLHLVLATLHVQFTISLSNINRINDTKYKY